MNSLHHQIFARVRHKNLRVIDCWGASGWSWSKITNGFDSSSPHDSVLVHNLKTLVLGLSPSTGADSVEWRWASSGTFTVRSFYNFLQDSGVSDRRFVQLWQIKAPLKVKIFCWLVLRNRIRTMDKLLKSGWTRIGNCIFCPRRGGDCGPPSHELPRRKKPPSSSPTEQTLASPLCLRQFVMGPYPAKRWGPKKKGAHDNCYHLVGHLAGKEQKDL